jgi:hypothetical protein
MSPPEHGTHSNTTSAVRGIVQHPYHPPLLAPQKPRDMGRSRNSTTPPSSLPYAATMDRRVVDTGPKIGRIGRRRVRQANVCNLADPR